MLNVSCFRSHILLCLLLLVLSFSRAEILSFFPSFVFSDTLASLPPSRRPLLFLIIPIILVSTILVLYHKGLPKFKIVLVPNLWSSS